jgi:hypothetical protein
MGRVPLAVTSAALAATLAACGGSHGSTSESSTHSEHAPSAAPAWRADALRQLGQVRTCLRAKGFQSEHGQYHLGISRPKARRNSADLSLGTEINGKYFERYSFAIAPTHRLARKYANDLFAYGAGSSAGAVAVAGTEALGVLPFSTAPDLQEQIRTVAGCAEGVPAAAGMSLTPAGA